MRRKKKINKKDSKKLISIDLSKLPTKGEFYPKGTKIKIKTPSENDIIKFLDEIKNTSSPNKALKNANKRYDEVFNKEEVRTGMSIFMADNIPGEQKEWYDKCESFKHSKLFMDDEESKAVNKHFEKPIRVDLPKTAVTYSVGYFDIEKKKLSRKERKKQRNNGY